MKINNGKSQIWNSLSPFFWGGGGGGLVPLAPLKIWDVMPHYLKTLFEQKQKFYNFDHFCLNDPLRYGYFSVYSLTMWWSLKLCEHH